MERRNIALLAVCVVVVAAVLVGVYAMNDRPDEGGDRVSEAVAMLEEGRFDDFMEGCSPELSQALGSAEALEATWDQYAYGIGDFVRIERTESQDAGANTVTTSYCRHSDYGLVLTITFDPSGSMVGLFFAYYEPEGADPLPDGLTETDVTVDAGTGYPLPGTIVSGGDSDVAVVIVHGSGPNDRDGTVGVQKPYRDIARGLASKGIDVLTYDKRTFVYGADVCDDPSRITVYDETVDDAVAAVMMLKDMGYDRVYLIGHSMGGMLAPRIVQMCDGACDGFVSLAGSPRTITDILADQLWAQYSKLPGAEVYRQYIDAELAKADALAGMTDEQRMATTVFGQSGYYIWSLNSIDEVAIAGSLDVPMLFLQGGADFQVYPDVDFAAWQAALGDSAEFRLFEGLGHPFTASEGPYAGTSAEYNRYAHVDASVIESIAGFVLG